MGSIEGLNFVSSHYYSYMKQFGYLPNIFCPYNDAEVTDGVANTITTQCGSIESSAAHLILVDSRGNLVDGLVSIESLINSSRK